MEEPIKPELVEPDALGGGMPTDGGVPVAGTVTLTQEQYAALKQQPGSAGASLELPTPNTLAGKWDRLYHNKVSLVLVILLFVALAIPRLSLLAFPIVILGVIAAVGFFRDSKSTSMGHKSRPVVLVFKIIAAVAFSILISIGAFIAFIFLLLSNAPANGPSS